MDEKMIKYIMENQRFKTYEIRRQDETVEIENEKYLISVTFYHQAIAEEMIYDKKEKDPFFYFHHECLNDHQTLSYINDFLNIAVELTSC